MFYLKTKEKKEVDFVITREGKPIQFIEIKLSDNKISQSLKYFSERFKDVESIQLVHNLLQNETVNNINILKAGEWLSGLSV